MNYWPHTHQSQNYYRTYYFNRDPYFQPYYIPFDYRKAYPDVNASLFNNSAISMQKLIQDASLVLNKIAASKTFAHEIMAAAQQSDLSAVDELIKSTGIKRKIDVSVNPDGINLKLASKVGGADCCNLIIGLRWR